MWSWRYYEAFINYLPTFTNPTILEQPAAFTRASCWSSASRNPVVKLFLAMFMLSSLQIVNLVNPYLFRGYSVLWDFTSGLNTDNFDIIFENWSSLKYAQNPFIAQLAQSLARSSQVLTPSGLRSSCGYIISFIIKLPACRPRLLLNRVFGKHLSSFYRHLRHFGLVKLLLD